MVKIADLVTFTEEILNGKLHFLCSESQTTLALFLNIFLHSFLCWVVKWTKWEKAINFFDRLIKVSFAYALLYLMLVITTWHCNKVSHRVLSALLCIPTATFYKNYLPHFLIALNPFYNYPTLWYCLPEFVMPAALSHKVAPL